MMQEVPRGERLVVARYMNGQVGKDRAEYDDYMKGMESERLIRRG